MAHLATSNKKRLMLKLRWDTPYIAMLYVDATALFPQGMANIKKMVDDRLAELGLDKTELGRRLGYKQAYVGYYQLVTADRSKLSEKRLEQVAEALDWPRTHFKEPAATLVREAYIEKTFNEFLASPVAKTVDPETIQLLRSMKWQGRYLPSLLLYQNAALAMEGRYTPAELAQAQMLEAADRETAAAQPAPIRRKTRAR